MPRDKSKRKARKAKQTRVKRYAKAREDCQLNGDLETVPAGAVRDEVVDPKTQGTQPLPGLVGLAVRSGWAVPEAVKPRIVDELVSIVEDRGGGGDEDAGPDAHVKVAAARVLQQIDRDQWERDHPELAGKVKGGTKVEVSQTVGVSILDLAREAAARPDPLNVALAAAAEEAERGKQQGGGGTDQEAAGPGSRQRLGEPHRDAN